MSLDFINALRSQLTRWQLLVRQNGCKGSSAESLHEIKRLAASEGKAASQLSFMRPGQNGQKPPLNRLDS